jgi:hypothetical protein
LEALLEFAVPAATSTFLPCARVYQLTFTLPAPGATKVALYP